MFKRWWQWIRFGEISEQVKSIDGGCASEIAYYDRFGRMVGYWAYGSFDPNLPYRG